MACDLCGQKKIWWRQGGRAIARSINAWIRHCSVCVALCAVNSKLHRLPSQLFALMQPSIDSQLFVENRDFCLPHIHSTIPLGGVVVGILPWRFVRKNWNGVATWRWKFFEDVFIRFDRIQERDRQTDTAWWHRPRLHSIAQQKTLKILLENGAIRWHFEKQLSTKSNQHCREIKIDHTGPIRTSSFCDCDQSAHRYMHLEWSFSYYVHVTYNVFFKTSEK